MILRRIATENFRNLAAATIDFHPQKNLIVGRNGQGKTNLLEAIYGLATTKSFRTPRIANAFRFGAETLFISGVLQRGGIERTLSVGLEGGEAKRRVLMINGERVGLQTYLRAMTVFAYSAARLEIIRGTPEERRRFIDRGVASIDPAYLSMLTRYGRVLKQRNVLLQGGGAAGALDAWDAEFQENAAAVQRSRGTYVEVLRGMQGVIAAPFGIRSVEMHYRPSAADTGRRRDELRAGMSLSGPQRDNLDFTVDGRPAHEVLSGGEQKMTVLVLKFAKLAIFGERERDDAVFVLDDLDAELDLEILGQLLARMPPQTQLFATSAKERLMAGLTRDSHRRLVIENGQVTAFEDFV